MTSYPAYQTVKVKNKDGLTTVTLNRPKKKNAINPKMSEEMVNLLDHLRFDTATEVLVITGAGDSFCSGLDLQESFADLHDKPIEWDRMQKLAQEWRGEKLRLFPKPTIAAVNGWCFGGGIPIVAACDLAIAADEAVFGISEINFGSIPAGPVAKVVGELMGPRDALYYILTGESFDGQQAARLGVVNHAVPAKDLLKEVREMADRLRSKNPVALRAAKELFKLSLNMGYTESVALSLAKSREVSFLQKGEWVTEGIGQFAAGKYRPGLGTYKRKTSSGGKKSKKK
jgi:trans-feruloyl-CoA hydratase/vanillin synthase